MGRSTADKLPGDSRFALLGWLSHDSLHIQGYREKIAARLSEVSTDWPSLRSHFVIVSAMAVLRDAPGASTVGVDVHYPDRRSAVDHQVLFRPSHFPWSDFRG